jgi:nucleotide-binding universal stress UspA family protein
MKNILVPTDFSSCANDAISLAFSLAKKNNATVHLLHIINPLDNFVPVEPFIGVDLISPQQLMPIYELKMNNAKEEMEAYAKEADMQGIKLLFHINIAQIYDEIIKHATTINADLIVMGTKGVSGIAETIMGSNAQKVVRLSSFPVLIVKKTYPDFSIKNIVYASNFEENKLNNNLNKLCDFASAFDAKIHLLFVNTPNLFETTTESELRLKNAALSMKTPPASTAIHNDLTVEMGIKSYFDKTGADLLSISTHGFTGIKRFLNLNIVESLVQQSDMPILTYSIKE